MPVEQEGAHSNPEGLFSVVERTVSKSSLDNLDLECNFEFKNCKLYIHNSITTRVLHTCSPAYELVTDLEIQSNLIQK